MGAGLDRLARLMALRSSLSLLHNWMASLSLESVISTPVNPAIFCQFESCWVGECYLDSASLLLLLLFVH